MNTPDPMNTQAETGPTTRVGRALAAARRAIVDDLTSHADETRERLDTETIVDGAGRKIGEVVKPPDPADGEDDGEPDLTEDDVATILGVGTIAGTIYAHGGTVEILGVLADVEIADTYPDGILLRVRPIRS